MDLPLDARALPFAAARFARVQAALVWGHSGTSGLPQVDYYLAPDGFDVDQHNFAEQIVRLGGVPLLPDPPGLGGAARRRGPEAEARRRLRGAHAPHGAPLLVVPLALRALAHPACDGALAAVLEAPGAVVVVVAAASPTEDFPDRAGEPPAAPQPVAAALQRRICMSRGWILAAEQPCGRLRLLRPLPIADVRALVRASVAVLDPTVAGDADGLLLAAQEHVPVVARRSGAAERLVGRGQSIIADDDAAFGRAAMRLATRKDARRASVVAARANADALFGGGDSDDLRAFLAAAAGRHPRVAARAAAAFRRRAVLVLAAAFAASLAAALTLRALRPLDDASPARHRRRVKGRLW